MEYRLISLACIALGAQLHAQNTAYNYLPDMKYEYYAEIKSTVLVKVQGVTSPVERSGTITFSIERISSEPDGRSTIRRTVESADLSGESGTGTTSFGRELNGTAYIDVIDSTGKVVQRDSLLNRRDVPGLDLVVSCFSMFIQIDRKQLAAGLSWERSKNDTLNLGSGGVLTGEGTVHYNVADAQSCNDLGCATIEYSGTADLQGSFISHDREAVASASITRNGTVCYDTLNHVILHTAMTEGNDITLRFNGGPGTINNTATTEIRIAYIKK